MAYRGTIVTVLAVGGCYFGGELLCGAGLVFALIVRVDQRTQAYGFSRSLTGNAADISSSLLMGLPMAGAAATATEEVAADGFASAAKLPAASTNIFKALAILPDAVQFVAGFLPGHDPAFFNGNTLGSN